MSTHQLQLRPIDDLRSERFFVPNYQRGYRWSRRQVTELLSDVWDFVQSGAKAKNEFYCLQPVVVAPVDDGSWEVVDGQQRLTTLYLILHFFNGRFQEVFRKQLYSIEYKTRPASADYLRELQPERAKENIDFFHMAEAFAAIQEWFADKFNRVNDIESAFLNDVKVIWYEIETEGGKPMEVFRRLNIGKIPLTDAELVKALFLRSSNFQGEGQRALQLRQLQIAHEWDAMERRLQEDDFWFFLTNARLEAGRIEFVLKLCAERIKQSGPRWSNASVFHTFAQRLSEPGSRAWTEWEGVKRQFLAMEEWFRDGTLYHMVGFLASHDAGEPHRAIANVSRLSAEAASKRAFRRKLKAEIFQRVFRHSRDAAPSAGVGLSEFVQAELGGLDYDSDTVQIRNVLLLFNLASLMESDSRARFPFDAYKSERWDIEHIRSVHSRMPQRQDDQKRWLGNVLEYLGCDASGEDGEGGATVRPDGHDDLVQEGKAIIRDQSFDSEAFEAFFKHVQECFDPFQDIEVDDSLGNLTLLDQVTNRGYGNAIFPIKRKTVIALDKVGKFVPLCTKNVFLKYYSARVDRMLVWSKEDAATYASAIHDCLTRFFAEEDLA
ncbi:DUF262 domain-containing protein [Paraburkholderia largidicola]|uniref:DUF262 domain-containing protein n=1 Tax=Paraburkholderia largidicola TaxID=3014751 RepID=UPI0015DB464F|nr:DUF262 domain-containing protein [Paraburkholderia sp. PGU16]